MKRFFTEQSAEFGCSGVRRKWFSTAEEAEQYAREKTAISDENIDIKHATPRGAKKPSAEFATTIAWTCIDHLDRVWTNIVEFEGSLL